MRNIFLIFVALLLAACAGTTNTYIKHNCPLKWNESLERKEDCATKEYAGIKTNTCLKNEKIHGAECAYQENGILLYERNWEDGAQNGLYIEYFDNGNIKIIKNYKSDELFGLYRQFFDDENLMFDGYRDGFCNLKYGTCYTEDGIAVPLKENDLDKACYNMLCLDAIRQQSANKH